MNRFYLTLLATPSLAASGTAARQTTQRTSITGNARISGTASATFRGLLPGNPMTGSYETKLDCPITWKLQDDSGGFQNFSGTLSSDGSSVRFKQTDPGGAQHGIIRNTSGLCSAAHLRTRYDFTVSGNTTPTQPGAVPRVISARGTSDTGRNGSFRVEKATMSGFLAGGGREILAFRTDPGAMVAARFVSEGK